MTVFRTVVDTGSLSAAGRQLGMPLATVSRKLTELEARLRLRLVHRSTRKLTLTDAGQDYLAACRRILDDVDEAERIAAGEYAAPRGELIVTAPIVFGRLHVLPVAAEFLRAYPEVDLRLVLGDRTLHLVDDHVDLAVRIGELPDSNLVAMRLGNVRPVTFASPAYLASRGAPAHPRELAKHDCVTFEGLAAADAWRFRIEGSETGVPVRSRLVVDTAEAAIDAAILGTGIARALSYQVAAARRSGAVDVVLQTFEPAPRPVSLVYAERGRLPLKLRAFVDFTAERLRARLAREADAP
jgi:DNA-binding transcriptional LysR family regulator